MFIFMGIVLEKSGLAEDLLETMGQLCGQIRGGLALSVILVGALLAATTGVVGATVVTMGIIALPSMLKHNYDPAFACGTITAAGTLGQVVPPSIVLILLADIVGVPVGELFMGAIVPSLLLVGCYITYILVRAWKFPHDAPAIHAINRGKIKARVLKSLVPPLLLIFAVLGSIFFGIASPTESAAMGGGGAIILAWFHGRLNTSVLRESSTQTMKLTAMVFTILVGATAFGLVFKSLGGDGLVKGFFDTLGGGTATFILVSMTLIFLLGFFLDFVEICFIVVPILEPVARQMGIDLAWFALMIAINLQTSFLTPPFGFSLFYLKAVSPRSIKIQHIYRGVIPFVIMQLAVLILVAIFPQIVSWLPQTTEPYRIP
jgi:tripartite ATP-independent transporter DctM subunit